MPVHRNRVIYQSEALFISPDSTGYHFTGANGSVTDSAGASHTASWGLSTPPKDIYQVVGQKSDGAGGWETARNEAGQAVGWSPEDGMAAWPKWNPKGLGGNKASFSADVDMDNLTVEYRLEADNEGTAGNVALVGDGVKPISQLITEKVAATAGLNGISVNPIAEVKSFIAGNGGKFEATAVGADGDGVSIVFTSAGGAALAVTEDIPTRTITVDFDAADVAQTTQALADNFGAITIATIAVVADQPLAAIAPLTTASGQDPHTGGDIAKILDGTGAPSGGDTITLAGGLDEIKSNKVIQGCAFEATAVGVLGDNVSVKFTDSLGSGAVVVAEAGNVITVTFDSVAGHTANDVLNPFNGAGITVATMAVNNGATVLAGATAENLQAGQDVAKASVVYTAEVESKLEGVEIVANDEGEHGNVLLTGDDASTVNALVAAYNAAKNPNHSALTVVSGGTNIPNAGVPIQLENGRDWYAKSHGTIIQQLHRVQSANYGFTVNRQDINQFGHASRLDSIVVESPTVNLDFSYYLLDGRNERLLEFVTDGETNTLSGMLTPELYQAGNNFFILTAPEARDAVRGDISLNENDLETKKSVISLGNGYITDYSIDISVGSIPTASVTVEGMNIRSDFGTTGNDVPAVDMRNGSRISDAWDTAGGSRAPIADGCTGLYSLPPAVSGYDGCNAASDNDTDGRVQDVAALRPGDVLVDLSSKSLISKSVAGNNDTPVIGSAHVQSASMSLPLGRTTLQRLGSVFGFSKAIDLPLSVSMNFNALVADIKQGNMMDLLCDCEEFDIGVTIFKPECAGCTVKDITDPSKIAMRFTMKGARLESENFSSTIGDNKSVDLTFSTQIGSSDDMENGLYVYGSESMNRVKQGENDGLPPAWTGVGGQTIDAVDGYLFGYRA